MTMGNDGRLRRMLAGSAAVGVLLVAGAAFGQVVAVDVQAQPLDKALRELGKETGTNILFSPKAVAGRRAAAVVGRYTPIEAARKLAGQAGLEVVEDGSGALIVRQPGASQVATVQQASFETVDQGSTVEVEEVVVTGSRLRRTTFDSPSPVVDVDREDLLESGYTDIAEALTDLPGVDIGVNLSTSQSAVQDNGLSTVSLRALGQNRTLTLIDGHRTVSNAGNKNAVSLSSIPEFFVDRVEISTGGASAIYGSDAVSGVVNIITTNKMDGVKLRAVAGVTDDGGGSTIEYSAVAGKRFLDDKLFMMIGGTYEKQDALNATDRKWATQSVLYDPDTNTVTSPDLSTYTPGGRFRSSSFYYDEGGLQKNFVTAVNGYETRDNGTLITPAKRSSGAIKINYQATPDIKIWGQFQASRVTTNSVREPYGLSSSTTYGVNDEYTIGNIARANPYVPSAIYSSSTSSISFRRRMTEVGELEIYNRRTTLRGWAGAEGKVFGDWDWAVTYGYGEYDGYQVRKNGLNMANVKNALNAELNTTTGQVQCKGATARANGCVPLNLFGIGSISKEAADYIRADVWYRPQNRQDTVEGYMTGELFQLPAGPIETAVGFELRRDKTRTTTDELTQNGLTNFAYIPEYSGVVKSNEAYVEASVPLVKDLPFVQRLEVDGAVRVAHYNLENVGTTLSYRAGLQWQPVAGLRFRTAWSRAQRAPDTTELYSPPRDDYDTVADVCSGVTASTPGTVAQNCRANAGIAAAIAADGVFTSDVTSVNSPNGGNIDLKEETADTLTVGFVLQPTFFNGFDLSVDYYDIKVADAISSLSNSQLLAECYQSTSGTDNRFCNVITRDAEGQISKILNLSENLDDLRASGVDVALRYRFDLDRWKVPGDFTFRANYSRRLKLESRYEGVNGVSIADDLGEVGTSKNEGKFSLAWRNRQWNVQWSANYVGEAVDDNDLAAAFAEAGVTNPLYLNVDAFWRHDLSVKFFPDPKNKDLRVFGTVKNVFDNQGPFLPDGTESGSSYNYSAVYGVSGRAYTLGLQVAF
ncbi:TonB-dependent receptor plug domain-containing protein [Caulobacter hibisci]|uniref:TonB-dependent receptor n=1 Tax=Caulobacter hibisci TaxID=2035993 RepID=A0ABS0T2Z0_9CAUL|nr:TonB-dependent receptor [Caulobacter hibisci]MBI1686106.1 TonB-dependent receptor [Caulobacter hibisci]